MDNKIADLGVSVMRTPLRSPLANCYCERLVGTLRRECLDFVIPFGERHLRRTIAEYVEHYHRERNHQGIENELIAGAPVTSTVGRIRRRSRLGGLLNYYDRAA